jgi:hypothetical protein
MMQFLCLESMADIQAAGVCSGGWIVLTSKSCAAGAQKRSFIKWQTGNKSRD